MLWKTMLSTRAIVQFGRKCDHGVGWTKARNPETAPQFRSYVRATLYRRLRPSSRAMPTRLRPARLLCRRVGTAPRTSVCSDQRCGRRLCPPYA
jgi:hypothetical protein